MFEVVLWLVVLDPSGGASGLAATLAEEWQVLHGAPFLFIGAVLVVGGVAFAASLLVHKGTIDGHKSAIDGKNATIEHLREKLDTSEKRVADLNDRVAPSSAGETPATVRGGETYTLLASDRCIDFDTTNGAAAANMITPSHLGQSWIFNWSAWGKEQVAPTINAPPGIKMVPYSGRAKPGVDGLESSTRISTPGGDYTLVWNGTELVRG